MGIWTDLTHLSNSLVKEYDRKQGVKHYVANLFKSTKKWNAEVKAIQLIGSDKPPLDFFVILWKKGRKNNAENRLFVACFEVEEFPFRLPFPPDKLSDLKRLSYVFGYKDELRRVYKSKLQQTFETEEWFLNNSVNIYDREALEIGKKTSEIMKTSKYKWKKRFKKFKGKLKRSDKDGNNESSIDN